MPNIVEESSTDVKILGTHQRETLTQYSIFLAPNKARLWTSDAVISPSRHVVTATGQVVIAIGFWQRESFYEQ
jgi:hypothetical protein